MAYKQHSTRTTLAINLTAVLAANQAQGHIREQVPPYS